ncbi:MAG: Ig-like domain-containing protein [Chitinophagales bacterium]|nr:Ig-like domain-containing protein [Chitinophagales bacterium]
MINSVKKRHTKILISTLLIVFFFAKCAVITSPTGGERDKTPPELLTEIPANKTTNFNTHQIHLQFNEFVQVNNQQNIIVSPKLQNKPKIEVKKNDIYISFKDTLIPNTTYSVFFGDNIVDVNESNPFPNYTFVFSTGDFIDSLELKTKIDFTETSIPDNSYLLLYKDLNDSAFLKEAPFYLSKIEKDGSAIIQHLKQGTYKVYALTDLNNNYYYDLPNENIAFLDSAITIDSNVSNIKLELFTPEPNQLKVLQTDKSIVNNQFNISWNKNISPTKDQIAIQVFPDTMINAIAFPNGEKTSKVYFPNLSQDTGRIGLKVFHNKQLIDSTINLSINNKKELLTIFNDSTIYKVFEGSALKLKSNSFSIFNIDSSKVQLLDSTKTSIPFTIEKDNDWQSYHIKAQWQDNMNYQLVLADSFLVDFGQNYTKMQKISILGQSVKKAGNLLINIELQEESLYLIANLKDNQGKVLDQHFLRDSQTLQINYKMLPAGQYFVEIIKDDNDNGIWNSGNFELKTLPEKKYKSQAIIIKENWDSEETIKVDFNQKTESTNIKNTDTKIQKGLEENTNEILNKTTSPKTKGGLQK